MIMPQMFLMGANLAAVINEHHPTLACGVPTIWNGLLALDTPIDFSQVRGITAGGAAVPQSLIEAFEDRFGATIIQGWGMTETSPLAAFGLPPARLKDGHDDMYYKIKAGRVVAGVEVRAVEEDGTSAAQRRHVGEEFEIRKARGSPARITRTRTRAGSTTAGSAPATSAAWIAGAT